MKKTLLFCSCLLVLAANAQSISKPAEKYAGLITEKALKEKLTIIASADMEGRETASPGQKKAAAYIEAQFKKMGLKPGNGDSYQMYFPVYQDQLNSTLLQVNGKTFVWDKDYSFSLNAATNGSGTYENIVFAGYGIVDPANKINDYADLDVTGKVVVVLEGSADAKAAPPTGRNAFTMPSSSYSKINTARTKGAVALLIVSKDLPKKVPTVLKGNMYLKRNTGNALTAGTISEEVASALLGSSTVVPISKLAESNKGSYTTSLKWNIDKTSTELQSSNVLAILPGTDKADEYLFLTGHYDHLGKRDSVIYYGADDDGSGTTAVLQMAEAFSAAARKGYKPRRNIVFMTVSGEEKGLWGSEYYSEHPIYPLDKTSADLNTDMIGRTDTERETADSLNYLYVIGHDKLSSELAPINEAANNSFTHLTLDYKFDDPKDVNRIYYRSDHFNFAKKGIPILFFYDGMLKADYHRPTDTVDKINFDLMAKRAQLIFLTAWQIADKDDLLKRDIPLNMPAGR